MLQRPAFRPPFLFVVLPCQFSDLPLEIKVLCDSGDRNAFFGHGVNFVQPGKLAATRQIPIRAPPDTRFIHGLPRGVCRAARERTHLFLKPIAQVTHPIMCGLYTHILAVDDLAHISRQVFVRERLPIF